MYSFPRRNNWFLAAFASSDVTLLVRVEIDESICVILKFRVSIDDVNITYWVDNIFTCVVKDDTDELNVDTEVFNDATWDCKVAT